uniref:Uncharacterized protein n=1 Tax=Anguilla anguilla TaxID=7936 RepID=A0A0E9VU49_ANGAN
MDLIGRLEACTGTNTKIAHIRQFCYDL